MNLYHSLSFFWKIIFPLLSHRRSREGLCSGFKYSDSQSAIDVFKEVASFIRPMSTEIAYLLIESEVGEGRVTINQVLAQRQAVVSCTKDLEVIQLLINVFALTV